MTAFNNAWTLLKNRGFEVDPRYEDERERNIQSVDNFRNELEMMEALGTPSQYREMVDSRNRQLSQLGPMHRHQQNQEAERIEAEGIQLPDTPSTMTFDNEEGDDYPDRSTAPPADIGRAGSSIPPGRGYEPKFLFNPFAPGAKSFDYQFDPVGQQPPRDRLKEYSESLEQTPLGQALAQARSQPPQPLQFEKAWATLKALPEQQVLGPDDQPLKTLHPAIQGMMERRGTLQPEGQEIQNIGHAPGLMPLSYGRDTSEAVYPRVGVPGREIRDDEDFGTATERLTRERNEAIPTEGALQGGYRTSMRPQTDLTISEGYPYEIPERQIYRREEGYPEYPTDRHPYTARFASMYGEPETMDEKFKQGYGRFMGK